MIDTQRTQNVIYKMLRDRKEKNSQKPSHEYACMGGSDMRRKKKKKKRVVVVVVVFYEALPFNFVRQNALSNRTDKGARG